MTNIKPLQKHQEQLVSYIQQVEYANDQKSFSLSIPLGKSMEVERDMLISAIHVSDIVHSNYCDEKRHNYLYKKLCQYFGTDINEDGIFSHNLEESSQVDVALSYLATLIFISSPLDASYITSGIATNLYAVGFEGSYDWSDWEYCLENDEFEQGRSFTFFLNEELSTDCGWSADEEEELKSQPLFGMLNSYSTQCHTLVKLV